MTKYKCTYIGNRNVSIDGKDLKKGESIITEKVINDPFVVVEKIKDEIIPKKEIKIKVKNIER